MSRHFFIFRIYQIPMERGIVKAQLFFQFLVNFFGLPLKASVKERPNARWQLPYLPPTFSSYKPLAINLVIGENLLSVKDISPICFAPLSIANRFFTNFSPFSALISATLPFLNTNLTPFT